MEECWIVGDLTSRVSSQSALCRLDRRRMDDLGAGHSRVGRTWRNKAGAHVSQQR